MTSKVDQYEVDVEAERLAYEADATAADEREYLISEMTPARVETSGRPMAAMAVRFDPDTLVLLRERAAAEGVGVTRLIRAWVTERLAEPDDGLPVEVAEALATLKDRLTAVAWREQGHVEPSPAARAAKRVTKAKAAKRMTPTRRQRSQPMAPTAKALPKRGGSPRRAGS